MVPLKMIAASLYANWMLAVVKLPFTLSVVTVLIATAVWTGTHRAEIAPSDLHNWGYAPRHLLALQWWRIATSLWITVGGWRFYVSLIAAGVFLGSLEWRVGSLRTGLLFFAVHAITLCCESLLVVPVLRYFQHPLGDLLQITHDVGPSAGYYGCLGALLWIDRWPPSLISLVALFLLVRIVVSLITVGGTPSGLSADVAHLIALIFGLAGGYLYTA